MNSEYSLYLHVPFCVHRCAYCDFNTYAGQDDSIPAYVDALCNEIEFVGNSATEMVTLGTVFFGGGTPSLLSLKQFKSILNTIRHSFNLLNDAEITIEANPGTVSFKDLERLRRIGVNRISFGVQSANSEELRMLERAHDYFDVIEAVASARQAGFDNLNVDLIFGLPEQRLSTWQNTVKWILDLHPEHISAYALTLEHGTPFGRWSARGLLPAPDPDLAAEMYDLAGAAFESSGYMQYEISNWAEPGHACRHNLQYWRSLPYLGLGAGAHGYANGYRYSNVLRIKTYIERLMSPDKLPSNLVFPFSPGIVNRHKNAITDDMSEMMITGLRLTHEGVSDVEFRHRFERSLQHVFGDEIDDLLKVGLLQWTDNQLHLTPRGRLLGNQVFMRFV